MSDSGTSAAKRVLEESSRKRLERLKKEVLCGACRGDHYLDAKTWFLNEAARAAAADRPELLADYVVDVTPQVYPWSEYREARQTDFSHVPRYVDSWDGFTNHLLAIRHDVDPYATDKTRSLTIGRGVHDPLKGRTDLNCSGVYSLFLDCDGVGTWDQFAEACSRYGLSVVFNQSASRSPTNWHARIPLANPILFNASDYEKRALAKEKLKHVTAILSGWAGFDGVGTKRKDKAKGDPACGFDLAVSGLGQAQFFPQRIDEDQAPVDMLVVKGGALDLDGLLAATGFDQKLAFAVSPSSKNGRARATFNATRKTYGAYTGAMGPLGQALQADGMLGRQKDVNGVFADCPFNPAHNGDAYYYPGSDSWWCSHDSCQLLFASSEDRRRKVIDSLSSRGRSAYEDTIAQTRSPRGAEKTRKVANIVAWIRKHEDKVNASSFLNAISGLLLSREYSTDFVEDVITEIEGFRNARERVSRTVIRRQHKQPVTGAGWIRKQLGVRASAALAEAIAEDTGDDFVSVSAHTVGMGLIRGEEAGFLHTCHDGLDDGDRLRSYVVRTAGCRVYGDKVKQYGREVGTQTKVCEGLGCPRCFFVKLLCTNELLNNGWTVDGKAVEGWATREAEFDLHRVTGIKSLEDLDAAKEFLSRWGKGVQRIRFYDHVEGKPALLIVTNDRSSSSGVRQIMHNWAKRNDATYSRERNATGKAAIRAAVGTQINLHLHQRELAEARDTGPYMEWIDWVWKKKLACRTKEGLLWPTRAVIAAKTKEANQEEWDIDWDEGGISYTAVELSTGYELGTSPYPHTIYQCIQLGKHRPGLQRILEPQDHEEQAELERIHNERCDRLGIPRIAEFGTRVYETIGAGASAQTWY